MSDPRWTTVDGLFEAALERAPQERAPFLREACGGNETLRQEVESLLAHASAKGFLDRPAHELEGSPPTHHHQLLVGHSLGSYRIVGLLGRGGMGEVYRAHDTTLGRDVAIKILPSVFTTDVDRRARFDREARVLAALNHPHIGAIYGVQETDGVRALLLELVEGDTLADRIAAGPVPTQEALSIARQIAEALEAAHEKSVVHRDVKPANVKLTPDGVVKVLDFGLAKAASDGPGPELTQSPTAMMHDTRDGVILGTAAYMSPEQARGKPVDKRTDIWAFGCVIYEMLTGCAPFAGDTLTDTLAAIVDREPNWPALPLATPDKIRDLLHRCLEKDLRRRLHDIADARIEIEEILSGASLGYAAPVAVNRTRRPGQLRSLLTVVAAATAAGVLTWIVGTNRATQSASPQVLRMTIASSGASTVAPNGARSLAFTPDGSRIVYVGNNGTQLFLRRLDQLDETAIVTAAAPLNWVFTSPDDQWVGFVEGATVKKMALTGGPVTTIVNTGNAADTAATWTADNRIIFANGDPGTGLQSVSADGGEVTVITRPDQARGESDHLWPEILPGGRAVLFTITATTGGIDASQVAAFDLATGSSKVLVRGGTAARYVSSGHLIYVAGGALRAVSFDRARLETRGTPVTVVSQFRSLSGAAELDVTGDGTLAYVVGAGAGTAPRTLVWVDRQGREEELSAPPRAYLHPRVSPDGTRIAVAVDGDIWIWNVVRQTLNQLTFDASGGFAPVWTPDGRRLLFFSPRRNEGLFRQAADGTAAVERLGTGLPSGVSPDGKQVLFSPSGGRDVMALVLDGTRREDPLIQSDFTERNGVVSPDGRWLAYESDRSGQFEIYVQPFPNVSAGQWLVSTTGGTRPLWAPNGRELFYVAPDGALFAVPVDAGGGLWATGSPAKILEGPYITTGALRPRTYDISNDGKRFLLVKRSTDRTFAPQIVMVRNWLEELKAQLPSR